VGGRFLVQEGEGAAGTQLPGGKMSCGLEEKPLNPRKRKGDPSGARRGSFLLGGIRDGKAIVAEKREKRKGG